MAPVWSPIDVDGASHYADVPLATAYLDDATALSTVAELAAMDARSPADQAARMTQIANALANAFRAMNLNPWMAPSWQGRWRREYASDNAGSAGPTPITSLMEHNYGPSITSSSTGWMVMRSFTVYSTVTHGAPRDQNVVLERVSITPTGIPQMVCLRTDDTSLSLCGPFAPGAMYAGHAGPSGSGCSDPNDWRCVSWNDAPLQPLRLAPAVRWSAEMFGQIAATIRTDVVGQIQAAVRAARTNGRTAVLAVSGASATSVPTQDIPDNPRTIRGSSTSMTDTGTSLGPGVGPNVPRVTAIQPTPAKDCTLPVAGFASEAERQAWITSNPWCDPTHVPPPNAPSLNPAMAHGSSVGTTILVVAGVAAAGGLVWWLAKRGR